jgi:hypothetical protein
MGFACLPNQAIPHYASENDFERFVAYGLLLCHNQLSHKKLIFEPTHLAELRLGFLHCLDLAANSLKDQWTGYFNDDQNQLIVTVPTQDRRDEVTFQWLFDLRTETSLCLTLCWYDSNVSEDFSVWLSVSAVDDGSDAILRHAMRLCERDLICVS